MSESGPLLYSKGAKAWGERGGHMPREREGAIRAGRERRGRWGCIPASPRGLFGAGRGGAGRGGGGAGGWRDFGVEGAPRRPSSPPAQTRPQKLGEKRGRKRANALARSGHPTPHRGRDRAPWEIIRDRVPWEIIRDRGS